MNLLLDTHTFLWFADRQQSKILPQPTTMLLEDKRNTVHLSLASVWELAIKSSIGKLKLIEPVIDLVKFHLVHNNIALLPITLAHLSLIETLPLHHKDPFDRLLSSQAFLENLDLVSIDEAFDAYGVSRVWLV